jgi:hypothetical protein
MRSVAFWLVVVALMIVLLVLVIPLYYANLLQSHNAAAVLVTLKPLILGCGAFLLWVIFRLIRGRG